MDVKKLEKLLVSSLVQTKRKMHFDKRQKLLRELISKLLYQIFITFHFLDSHCH